MNATVYYHVLFTAHILNRVRKLEISLSPRSNGSPETETRNMPNTHVKVMSAIISIRGAYLYRKRFCPIESYALTNKLLSYCSIRKRDNMNVYVLLFSFLTITIYYIPNQYCERTPLFQNHVFLHNIYIIQLFMYH